MASHYNKKRATRHWTGFYSNIDCYYLNTICHHSIIMRYMFLGVTRTPALS